MKAYGFHGEKFAALICAQSLRIIMKDKRSENIEKIASSYECGGCGAFFESLDRPRQHEVDCKEDDFVEPL